MTHHSLERDGDAMMPELIHDATPKRYGLSLGFRDSHGITSGRTFATVEEAARLIYDVFEEAERLPDGVTWQILPDNDVLYAHVFEL